MTTTIRKTRAGRSILELDGYSEKHRAYVSGALTCRVSLPGDCCVVEGLVSYAGENWLPSDLARDARRGDVIGARVLAWGRIQ